MADTKISALTAGTTPTGVEKLAAVQSSASVSLTVDQIGRALAHPGHVAGRWYCPPLIGHGTGTAMAADTVKLFPFFVNERMTISDLGVRITTLAAGGHIRLGIYASNASTKYPTGTALSSCVVATDSSGAISATLGANVSLNAGLYWLASQSDNSTVVCNSPSTFSFMCAAFAIGDSSFSNVTIGSVTPAVGYTVSGAYASGLPDLTSSFGSGPTVATNTQIALVFPKVISVP